MKMGPQKRQMKQQRPVVAFLDKPLPPNEIRPPMHVKTSAQHCSEDELEFEDPEKIESCEKEGNVAPPTETQPQPGGSPRPQQTALAEHERQRTHHQEKIEQRTHQTYLRANGEKGEDSDDFESDGEDNGDAGGEDNPDGTVSPTQVGPRKILPPKQSPARTPNPFLASGRSFGHDD